MFFGNKIFFHLYMHKYLLCAILEGIELYQGKAFSRKVKSHKEFVDSCVLSVYPRLVGNSPITTNNPYRVCVISSLVSLQNLTQLCASRNTILSDPISRL